VAAVESGQRGGQSAGATGGWKLHRNYGELMNAVSCLHVHFNDTGAILASVSCHPQEPGYQLVLYGLHGRKERLERVGDALAPPACPVPFNLVLWLRF